VSEADSRSRHLLTLALTRCFVCVLSVTLLQVKAQREKQRAVAEVNYATKDPLSSPEDDPDDPDFEP